MENKEQRPKGWVDQAKSLNHDVEIRGSGWSSKLFSLVYWMDQAPSSSKPLTVVSWVKVKITEYAFPAYFYRWEQQQQPMPWSNEWLSERYHRNLKRKIIIVVITIIMESYSVLSRIFRILPSDTSEMIISEVKCFMKTSSYYFEFNLQKLSFSI